jgi:hypothetical protein
MDIKSFKSFNENDENSNYMFFANLQHICKMASEMLEMDESQIDDMLTDGHDWANDHISKSMESISHVYNFLNASDLESDTNIAHDNRMMDKDMTDFEPLETNLEESIKRFKK